MVAHMGTEQLQRERDALYAECTAWREAVQSLRSWKRYSLEAEITRGQRPNYFSARVINNLLKRVEQTDAALGAS